MFKVDNILNIAEKDPVEKYQMLMKGGVIQIEIIWNCNYDLWSECFPKYEFSRFDMPYKQTKTANGFNFRY